MNTDGLPVVSRRLRRGARGAQEEEGQIPDVERVPHVQHAGLAAPKKLPADARPVGGAEILHCQRRSRPHDGVPAREGPVSHRDVTPLVPADDDLRLSERIGGEEPLARDEENPILAEHAGIAGVARSGVTPGHGEGSFGTV